MNKKYPSDLFWTGFILNLLGHFFFLFYPAVILMIIGIWNGTCLKVGLALFIADIVFSFIEQLKIRKATLESDNPNFTKFQDAMLSPNWRDDITSIVEGETKAENDSDGE